MRSALLSFVGVLISAAELSQIVDIALETVNNWLRRGDTGARQSACTARHVEA